MSQVYSQVVSEIFREWLNAISGDETIPATALEQLQRAITSGDIQSPSKIKALIDRIPIEVPNHDA